MASVVQHGNSAPRFDREAVGKLAAAMRGSILQPDDGQYDHARRVFNGMIDKRPAVVARCAGASDVLAALDFARTFDLEIAVRGGGHSVAGKAVCDGGIVIDLGPMKGARTDLRKATIHAQSGLLLSDLDRETQAFGLATPLGVVSLTGIAGLTLGGGIGWLNGKYGLTCDNVLSVDVVTADGALLHADHEQNEDLFWGVRGGGGNFGIVTSFEYRLHSVSRVLVADAWYDLSDSKVALDTLRGFDEYARNCPDEVTTMASFMLVDGIATVQLTACFCGQLDEGERLLAPVTSFGRTSRHAVRSMRYLDMQSRSAENFPPGRFHYWKGSSLRALSDEAIEILREFTMTSPSPFTEIALQQVHGAAARVAPTATAFTHRYDHHDFIVLSTWVEPDETERNLSWTRSLWHALQAVLDGGVYVNNLGDEGSGRVREAYGVNYERLVSLKRKYDPTNLFHLNHNVAPDL